MRVLEPKPPDQAPDRPIVTHLGPAVLGEGAQGGEGEKQDKTE